ncbi:MAG: SDR family NAD(P)-dependent oxidoreductase [Gemmatimonadetes bacterium]|nr:SDR family NAD(P)-dependent oxidoreductase [Gemmatimonadota bacterium]
MFDNEVVWVTGSSTGIGRAAAIGFAEQGCRVAVHYNSSEEEAREVAGKIEEAGGDAMLVKGDVSDSGDVKRMVGEVEDRYGRLDVLVNNAGVSAHGRFADGDDATLRRIMEVNFLAAAELTRRAIPVLSSGTRPAIVNIGSILGHRGIPLNSEYCASKFALRGWSESLRAELAPLGIDVLLVSPGTTETEFFDHLLAKRGALPWGKAKGIPAATVARQTVRALERGRREIFPNWRGRALVLANRLFPRMVDRVMVRLTSRRQD